MALGQVIGNLKVIISGDASSLDASADDAKRSLGGIKSAAGITGAALMALAAAAAAAAIALAYKLTKASMETIDAQSKLAARVGGSTAAVQGLTRAADLAGIPFESLSKSLGTLNARLGEALVTGSGAAYDALQLLGISAQALSEMDVDERIAAMSDRMIELGWSTQQQASFMRDLGIRNQEFINLMQGGGDAIRGATAEIRALGLAVSDIEGVQIEQANDALASMGLVLQSVGNQIAVQLAPYLQGVADAFLDWATEGTNAGDTIKGVIEATIWVVGGLADAIFELQKYFKSLQVVGLAVMARIQEAFYIASTRVQEFGNTIAETYNAVAGIAKLPKIEIDYEGQIAAADTAHQSAYAAYEAAAQANDEFQAMSNGPAPSERLAAWVEDVKAKSAEAAAAAVAAREAISGGNGEIDEDPNSPAAQAAVKRQEEMDAQFEQLRNSLISEEILENESHAKRLEQLAMFYESGRMAESEYRSLRESAEKQHQDKLNEIAAKAQQARDRLQTESINRVVSTMGAISSAIEAGGNDQFGIVKGISVAMALLKGYESIVSSYAAGTAIGGPPVGIAFAALAAATTAAQIAQIMSVGPGSGGTPHAVSAGGSTSSSSGPAGGSNYSTGGGTDRKVIDVRGLSPGQMFDGDSMRYLIEQLRDAQKDGWEINI